MMRFCGSVLRMCACACVAIFSACRQCSMKQHSMVVVRLINCRSCVNWSSLTGFLGHENRALESSATSVRGVLRTIMMPPLPRPAGRALQLVRVLQGSTSMRSQPSRLTVCARAKLKHLHPILVETFHVRSSLLRCVYCAWLLACPRPLPLPLAAISSLEALVSNKLAKNSPPLLSPRLHTIVQIGGLNGCSNTFVPGVQTAACTHI